MSINHYFYGVEVAQRWLQTGWPEDLNAIIADASAKDIVRRNAGNVALAGAFCTIAQMLEAVQAKGVQFSVALPSVDRVLYARSRSAEDYSRVGQLLINAAVSLRKQRRDISISWLRPKDDAKVKSP